MAKKSHTEKSVGPWAKHKLDALERYLEAYMLVMKHQRFKLFYVDAFAGAGIVKIRGNTSGEKIKPEDALIPEAFTDEDSLQLTEFIAGSPLRALSLSKKFDHYRFIDLDPKRVADLDDLAKQFTGADVKTYLGEANERVQFIASKFSSSDWRGVAFLDPYGAHLHWGTLEALAATKKFDVIINFPLGMTINRFVMHSPDEIPRSWQDQLDKCFGCPDWRETSYATETNLLGVTTYKRPDAGSRLLQLYVQRLKEIFGNVAVPSLVKNTKGAPLYYLLWASSNARGKGIADHILGLGEKVVIPAKRPL